MTWQDGPDVLLWAALVIAPPEGTTVPDLMTATGMSRPWIYLRLRELAEQGHVTPSQPWPLASRNRRHSVIVYVYVSPACLHVKGTNAAVRQRRRQLPKVTAKGAAQGQPRQPKEVMPTCRHTQSSKSRRCSTSAATRSTTCSEPASSAASRSASLRRITEDHLAEFIASLEDHAA